jgi:hypothetical protein
MRNLLLLSPLLLGACATQAAAPSEEPPVMGQSGSLCRSGDYSRFNGRTRTAALEAELKRASGAQIIRWVPPGVMVTMDYREDRMTVKLDAQNRILSASCG